MTKTEAREIATRAITAINLSAYGMLPSRDKMTEAVQVLATSDNADDEHMASTIEQWIEDNK